MSFFDTLIDDSENINEVKQDPFHTVANKSEKEIVPICKNRAQRRVNIAI